MRNRSCYAKIGRTHLSCNNNYCRQQSGKPPCSYVSLILMALNASPTKKLTLGEIYLHLQQTYPFFRGKYNGWKNSIRHNLSTNKCFVKLYKSNDFPRKGHYWAIDCEREKLFNKRKFKNQVKGTKNEKTCNKFKELIQNSGEPGPVNQQISNYQRSSKNQYETNQLAQSFNEKNLSFRNMMPAFSTGSASSAEELNDSYCNSQAALRSSSSDTSSQTSTELHSPTTLRADIHSNNSYTHGTHSPQLNSTMPQPPVSYSSYPHYQTQNSSTYISPNSNYPLQFNQVSNLSAQFPDTSMSNITQIKPPTQALLNSSNSYYQSPNSQIFTPPGQPLEMPNSAVYYNSNNIQNPNLHYPTMTSSGLSYSDVRPPYSYHIGMIPSAYHTPNTSLPFPNGNHEAAFQSEHEHNSSLSAPTLNTINTQPLNSNNNANLLRNSNPVTLQHSQSYFSTLDSPAPECAVQLPDLNNNTPDTSIVEEDFSTRYKPLNTIIPDTRLEQSQFASHARPSDSTIGYLPLTSFITGLSEYDSAFLEYHKSANSTNGQFSASYPSAPTGQIQECPSLCADWLPQQGQFYPTSSFE